MKGKLLLMSMMAVLVMSIAYAADSMEPASSTTVGGSLIVNVTTDNINNVLNCTVTISSATSGSSAITVVARNGSSTATHNIANVTLQTNNNLTDASDYSFAASCVNATNTVAATVTSTSVTVDNGVPTCTFDAALTSNTEYLPTQDWSVTCTNATSASIQFGGNQPISMVETSDVCTYTGSLATIAEGSYDLKVHTSDGTDTTTCQLTNVKIDKDSIVRKVGGALAVGATKKTGNTGLDKNMLLLVGIAVVGFFIWKKK